MKKYLTAYSISLQEVLQLRWSLVMDRLRGLALIVSLYFLWSTLLEGKEAFLGYSREQMITYVLGMSLLRALILSNRGWELIHEISSGKLSSYLLRPINYFGFQMARDLAQKSILAASATVEIAILVTVFRAPLYLPGSLGTYLLFLLTAALSLVLYFQLSMLVCSAAFWTAESIGPLFCFELILQFCAGAFFPLDVLPMTIQKALHLTPFPYLVFFPLQVYLERSASIPQALAVQVAWILLLTFLLSKAWGVGLRDYAAEGG